MPTPRQFADYPKEYSNLFLHARKTPLYIREVSPNRARRLRNHLYAFRSAALANLEASGRLGLLLPLARMKLDGKLLTIYYPDNESQKAISHAINSADSGIPHEVR